MANDIENRENSDVPYIFTIGFPEKWAVNIGEETEEIDPKILLTFTGPVQIDLTEEDFSLKELEALQLIASNLWGLTLSQGSIGYEYLPALEKLTNSKKT